MNPNLQWVRALIKVTIFSLSANRPVPREDLSFRQRVGLVTDCGNRIPNRICLSGCREFAQPFPIAPAGAVELHKAS